MTDLDRLIDRNDPARAYAEDTEQLIAEMAVTTSREASTAPGRQRWWRMPRIVVPIGIGAALVTTAGTLFIPPIFGINGRTVVAEVTIPIHYTTETGVTVDCTYGIYVGDPAKRTAADRKLADYLNTRGWSGIGQEIYDQAMANPFVPALARSSPSLRVGLGHPWVPQVIWSRAEPQQVR